MNETKKIIAMNEIERIIADYKEACQEWGVSEYKKEQLKKDAFDEILKTYELVQTIEPGDA